MSRTLSMNNGSGDSLKSSIRCGLSPNARQIFDTAVCDIPVAFAIDRVDQCVAFAGVSSSVLTITRSTSSSLIERGLPGRGPRRRPVVRPIEPLLREPLPPLRNRDPLQIETLRDLTVVAAVRARQHNPTP